MVEEKSLALLAWLLYNNLAVARGRIESRRSILRLWADHRYRLESHFLSFVEFPGLISRLARSRLASNSLCLPLNGETDERVTSVYTGSFKNLWDLDHSYALREGPACPLALRALCDSAKYRWDSAHDNVGAGSRRQLVSFFSIQHECGSQPGVTCESCPTSVRKLFPTSPNLWTLHLRFAADFIGTCRVCWCWSRCKLHC